MRLINAAIMSWLGLFLLAPAQAQQVTPPAQFTAFSIPFVYEERRPEYPPPLELLSDADGKTVFSMPHLESRMDILSGGTAANSEYWMALGITPRAGYTVTSIEWSGKLTGVIQPVFPPPYATWTNFAELDNSASFGFYGLGPDMVDDLNGEHAFSMLMPAANALPIFEGIAIEMYAFMAATAGYTHYSWREDGKLYEHKVSSLATITLTDARFTVHWEVVPVPEPSMWMMLMAGIAALVARRRFSRSGS